MFAPRLHGHLRTRRAGGGQTNQGNDQAIHSAGQFEIVGIVCFDSFLMPR